MHGLTKSIPSLAVALLIGANATTAQPPPAHDLANQLRQSATREFAYGIHLKPDANTLSARAREFVPLIVREVVADADMLQIPPYFFGGCDVRWFAFPHWLEGRMSDWRRAFVNESSVAISGTEHEQITFAWSMGKTTEGHESADARETERQQQAIIIAVRITLGLDGFPVVWEILDSRIQYRVLYVSRSAEFLARKQFGDPLPQRQFAMERSVEEAPNVILVRALEDGPVPMGPYLYVDGTNRIVSVLCRCNPAQVDQFVKEDLYQVQPVTQAEEAFSKAFAGVDLADALRWPQGL